MLFQVTIVFVVVSFCIYKFHYFCFPLLFPIMVNWETHVKFKTEKFPFVSIKYTTRLVTILDKRNRAILTLTLAAKES